MPPRADCSRSTAYNPGQQSKIKWLWSGRILPSQVMNHLYSFWWGSFKRWKHGLNIRPLLIGQKPTRRASGMRFGNIGHWIDKWCSRQGTPAFLLLEYVIHTDLLLHQMLMFFNLCNVLQYINQSPKWSELVSRANNEPISSIVQKTFRVEGGHKECPFLRKRLL